MDAQRALLDELMGAARDLTDAEKKDYREVQWDDREVCRPFMVRFCPHDLFVNTKSDLGPCPKIHDQKLKESFEASPRHAAYFPKFEAELFHACEKLVMDLDRKVRRGRERITLELDVPSPPLFAEKSEQLSMLEEKIKKLLEQVETLGESGKVDEAEALMKKVDLLNFQKTALTQHSSNDKAMMLTQEKKMALCEICGSFLVANDVAERTQSHVTGKQHIGYGLVRDFMDEFRAAKEKEREEERMSREKEAERTRQREEEHANKLTRRDAYVEREQYHSEREQYHSERDRSYERSRRGSRDGGRGSDGNYGNYRNGRDWNQERSRDRNINPSRDRSRRRSRSRSPIRHGSRRSSRSPARPY